MPYAITLKVPGKGQPVVYKSMRHDRNEAITEAVRAVERDHGTTPSVVKVAKA